MPRMGFSTKQQNKIMKISCKATEQQSNSPTGLRPVGPGQNKSASNSERQKQNGLAKQKQNAISSYTVEISCFLS
jgi:hypothetical protein